jgi:peroxiredoxin
MMPPFPRRIPNVLHQLRVRDESIGGDNPFRWEEKTTHEIVGRGKNIIFSLPGAFTPTCSTYQLPDFEKLFSDFQEQGVENIFCLSVNDAFVMNCWAKDQGLNNVQVIPDGSAKFTSSIGMDVYKDNLGFGIRSWRYALVVENFEITKQFVERGFCHNATDDPYGVSAPQNILDFLQGKEYDAGGEALQLNLSDGVGSEDKLG